MPSRRGVATRRGWGGPQAILESFSDPLNAAMDLTEAIEDELVTPPLEDLKTRYKQLFNKTIGAAITDAFPGAAGVLLASFVDDAGSREAQTLNRALSGSVDQRTVVELLALRTPMERAGTASPTHPVRTRAWVVSRRLD